MRPPSQVCESTTSYSLAWMANIMRTGATLSPCFTSEVDEVTSRFSLHDSQSRVSSAKVGGDFKTQTFFS
jgi:hypothetical protein